MDRRATLVMASTLVLAAPLIARAQIGATIRRIGFLASGWPAPAADLKEMFVPLKERGWIEGANLLVERRYGNDRSELLRVFAEELVRLNVELIVTEGTDATLAAKNATSTIPIVTRFAIDPVRTGLVSSLARPGGNITGYSTFGVDLDVKKLALLRELLPALQRVGRLDTSTNADYRALREELEAAYRSQGIQPIFVEVDHPNELDNAIGQLSRRAQAMVVGGANFFWDIRNELMRTAFKYALPTMGDGKYELAAGALVTYSYSSADLRRRNAAFLDRILRGAKPADLPIERPTQFELGINLKTAMALGVVVPQTLLSRADEVIQ
jgi:putative tryptophan/tyrosine transport system substrate-binding protein